MEGYSTESRRTSDRRRRDGHYRELRRNPDRCRERDIEPRRRRDMEESPRPCTDEREDEGSCKELMKRKRKYWRKLMDYEQIFDQHERPKIEWPEEEVYRWTPFGWMSRDDFWMITRGWICSLSSWHKKKMEKGFMYFDTPEFKDAIRRLLSGFGFDSGDDSDADGLRRYFIGIDLPESGRPDDYEAWYRSFLPQVSEDTPENQKPLIITSGEPLFICGFLALLSPQHLEHIKQQPYFCHVEELDI